MANEDASADDLEAANALRELPSISLVDHTGPAEEPTSESEVTRAPSKISHVFTHGSIRQTIARRKYQRLKWQEGRGSQSAIPYTPGGAEEDEGSTSTQAKPASTKSREQDGGSDSDTWGKGRMRRGGRKVKDAIRSQKHRSSKHHINDPDAHIDILYENQRGFFFAGIPHFSSNSLLNFDPGAWLDSRFRPSAVDITNAQVPDPSWEWAWRCWYVDMSGDVDEEGWEYSFWFGKGCAWHGTHPWFHSFVRRRRWLRKRSKTKGLKPKEEAHALTSDYFTIHSQMRPGEEDADSIATSEKKTQYAAPTSSAWGAKSWEEQAVDLTEISNMPDLLRGLKSATIDREKIVLVRRFLDQGGEELHYLAENMEHIMKLLIFQNSRRQLLSILMHEFEAAEQHRDEHVQRGEAEDEQEKRHIDNLLKAVEAADEQCKQLEYWSDVKGMARDGEILRAAEHTHGWDHGWQGLDATGPAKQGGSPPDAPSDDDDEYSKKNKKKNKGKQPERGTGKTEVSGGQTGDTVDPKTSVTTCRGREDDAARASNNSKQRDVFYSPEEGKTQAQASQSPTSSTPRRSQELPTPSQESQLSLDTFESAHSRADEESDEDDQATERAPSEDEGDIEDTPPSGTTPTEAVTKALNGHTMAEKGTASQQSPGESNDVD